MPSSSPPSENVIGGRISRNGAVGNLGSAHDVKSMYSSGSMFIEGKSAMPNVMQQDLGVAQRHVQHSTQTPDNNLSHSDEKEGNRLLLGTSSFNGIGKCAVFPVPISSLSISVWSTIRNGSSADLTMNPYSSISLPISELLELTLPPVDASVIDPWPKPLGHYSRQSAAQAPVQVPLHTQLNYRPQHHQGQQHSNNIAGLQSIFPGVKIQGGPSRP